MAIVVGVTAGFVTAAPTGSLSGWNGNDFTNCDVVNQAQKHTSPAGGGTITEIGWYAINPTSDVPFGVALYNTSTSPKDVPWLVVGSGGYTAKGTTSGWKTINGLNIGFLGSTDYWIAFQLDDTATVQRAPLSIPHTGARHMEWVTQTRIDEPWGGLTASNGGQSALYALYTPSGAVEVTGEPLVQVIQIE